MNDNNKNLKDQSDSDAEVLFKRLNDQLNTIELREIIDCISEDDLREQGYTSSDPIIIEQASHQRKIKRLNLSLEPGIEFLELPVTIKLADIKIEDISHLKINLKGTLLGFTDSPNLGKIGIGNNILTDVSENKKQFTAAVNGRLLITGNTIHIFPSDINSTVNLTVSADKMTVMMTCTPSYGNGAPLTLQTVREILEKNNISRGVKTAEIEKAVNNANKNLSIQQNILIAEGTPPIHGKNGEIHFLFDTEHQSYDFSILPDGRIDYKNSFSLLLAKEGQLLAKIDLPMKGMPGVDVYNNPVPAEEGVPANLISGKGIRLSQDKREFYAAMDGCIIYNRPVISVVDTYVVKGDVDYSTGNISFNGTIIVQGSVLDGFEIKAEGDIFVLKNVEAALLRSSRDIVIRGGIQGKGKGRISAGRDVFTEYVQNGYIEAQGVIEVGNFSINSHISTTDRLILMQKRGTFIGGEVYALKGIEVRSLGSEQGVKTYVEIGTNFLALNKIKELNEITKRLSANLKKIDQTLKTVFLTIKNNQNLSTSKKPLLTKALNKRKEIATNIDIIQVKIDQLLEQSQFNEPCFAKIFETCYSDVTIKIHGHLTIITKQRNNIKFYEDIEAGRIGCKFY